jgi:hypothetical protein
METSQLIQRVKDGTPNVPLYQKRITTADLSKPVAAGGRVVQVFSNTDMRNGHDGLAAIAKEAGIDVAQLERGHYVVFINTHRTQIKMFAAYNVVASYKARAGEVLNLNTIPLIIRSFNGSGVIKYDEALKQAVEEALSRKRRQSAEQ